MISLSCPRQDCDYVTGEFEAVVSAALLTAHSTVHSASSQPRSNVRPPPVDRPKLSRDIPKADWLIFKSRWKSFKTATNISNEKIVHQLLGCLDSDLITLVYNENNSPRGIGRVNSANTN